MEIKTKVSEGGRIVIPADFRKALGIEVGSEVILKLEEDGLRVFTPQLAIQQAQALVRRYVSRDRSLADELINERRKEYRHEQVDS